ncbi:kinase-like domain-containing protein [Rhizophagus clarus]|uniref:Kinase-like domain-containing protein n=1 Tax=Rhizophagus clarus TaxID=94130 RepID=A0A8H3QBN3_9GLOM|nr:kinase-like domain-containing protein [Rhizophagus clarus]
MDKCKKCDQQYTNIENKWCKPCQINYLKENFTNWSSGNEKIDNIIQRMQLEIKNFYSKIVEWVPYYEFDEECKIYSKVSSGKWKNGPLYWNSHHEEYIRSTPNIEFTLKRSSNNVDDLLNEVNKYPIDYMYSEYHLSDCAKCDKMYIRVYSKLCKPCHINSLKESFGNWTSGNEKIDRFTQEMQLNENGYTIVYSALWSCASKSRLYYKKVILENLCNSYNNLDRFLNETYEKIKLNESTVYGISQNPDTKDYIIILNIEYCCEKCYRLYTYYDEKWCKHCQINYLDESTSWTGEEKIDDFIEEETRLKINCYTDMIFEWIPYSQFTDVKEIGTYGSSTVYSAIWKNGPLSCFLINEVNKYPIKNKNITLTIYGISQNPNTKYYTLILNDEYLKYLEYCCTKCDKLYTDTNLKWCEICQMNDLKKDFKNWTSGNENVDKFIQEMKLKAYRHKDIPFEWIPYDQFNNIKKVGKGGFAIVYSAIWKDGPKYHYQNDRKNLNKLIALKSLNDSQNITSEFLKEIQSYSREMRYTSNSSNILKIYGMSQNPDTNNYIMILEYANGGNFDDYWIKKNYKSFNWNQKVNTLCNIIKGLKEIHQKSMVHRDFHTGNILFDSLHDKTYISDMGLCGEVGNIDEKNIYGVMPYVAPEVLRGRPYTQAADIYSFGMIMYFTATGRQPFQNCAHDQFLVLDICEGIRPVINEPVAPKCYIDLMKKCWDLNPDDRPNVIELEKLINSFKYVIKTKFKEADEYRKANLASFKNNLSATHPQAIYTSRLLNPFTKDLLNYVDDQ